MRTGAAFATLIAMADVDVGDIDAVIARLDEIIEAALEAEDRMGWFAAMYRRVTIAVRDGILNGRFENGPRMVRFDAIFAHRFINAWDDVQADRRPTKAWQVAFAGARKRRLVIVQQLLLGMNAHINLDLGIAAAGVAREFDEPIEALKGDFDEINVVLTELTDGFVGQVHDVSPWFGLLDKVGGRADDEIIRWSIGAARDAAWLLARELSPDPPVDQARPIAVRDEITEGFGKLITRPGILLPMVLLVVRSREPNDVNEVTRFMLRPPGFSSQLA